ncbi:MAG: HDIG domain-containing protein [Puniceicoccales bacterium]|nr:HDIG domain-containing protein [Puniceicoccales bacterium]
MELLRRVMGDTESNVLRRFRRFLFPALLTITASVLLTLVCFWGHPSHLPVLIPGTVSHITYAAPFSFNYDSKEYRDQRAREARQETAPVYRIDFAPERQITPYADLAKRLERDFDALRKLPAGRLEKACAPLAEKLPGATRPETLAKLIRNAPNPAACGQIIREIIPALTQILRGGVYEPPSASATIEIPLAAAAGGGATPTSPSATPPPHPPFIQAVPSAGIPRADALRNLADAIATLAAAHPGLHDTLLELFRPGVIPNVLIDQESTSRLRTEAGKRVGSITMSVSAGDLLVERGEKITPVVVERWEAYRAELSNHNLDAASPVDTLRQNLLPVFAVVFLLVFFTRLAPPSDIKRRQTTLVALLVPANLLLIRLFLELGTRTDVLRHVGTTASSDIFLWFAPPSIAALFLTLLAGPYLALLGAFSVSMLAALMLGHSLEVFLIASLSNLVAIHFCDNARSRNAILKAGVFSGATTALAIAIVIETNDSTSLWTTVFQLGGSVFGGIVLGLVALGILPVLERIFKLTSNFTYGELANAREPLLAKLQIIAPGTYNHSANVATLAESAAASIGANAILCHCASLYHDIGKILKPEYFVENQQAHNLHEHLPPAISATVIKSHVREGATLARASRLPRAIVDIIEQHHGTGLIEFFHNKALTANRAAGLPDSAVDEATYRYQTPKPQTREAAIVLFADSLEAATRSLKHYSAKNIEQLVGRIVAARINDGQLDECPLTFRDIQTIRRSLRDTLLHMYHHRIEYPSTSRPPNAPPLSHPTHEQQSPAQTPAAPASPPAAPSPPTPRRNT